MNAISVIASGASPSSMIGTRRSASGDPPSTGGCSSQAAAPARASTAATIGAPGGEVAIAGLYLFPCATPEADLAARG